MAQKDKNEKIFLYSLHTLHARLLTSRWKELLEKMIFFSWKTYELPGLKAGKNKGLDIAYAAFTSV